MREDKKGGTAQTSVDFLIGFSIFAVTLLFVLQMATGSVVNTAPESQTEEALAERTAELTYQNLTSDGAMFEEDYEGIREWAVRTDDYDFNITVKNTEGTVRNSTGSQGEVPENSTARIAGDRRVISIDNESHVIDVRVWENATDGGAST